MCVVVLAVVVALVAEVVVVVVNVVVVVVDFAPLDRNAEKVCCALQTN